MSRDATEDLIQAAGIRLAEALTRCSTLPDNYLRRVIRNAMNDEFRAGRIIDDPERRVDCDGEPMDSDEIEVTDESPVASEIFLDHGPVRQWKATLSPREQIVAEVLWVQDATEREAAMMLGISKTRVHQLKLDLMRRAQSDLLALVA